MVAITAVFGFKWTRLIGNVELTGHQNNSAFRLYALHHELNATIYLFQLINYAALVDKVEETLQMMTFSAISSKKIVYMITSADGNVFRVTGPMCGEFTGYR